MQYREVKRVARAGETIKVTGTDGHGWPIGTVGVVTGFGSAFEKWVYIENIKHRGIIPDDQYVVLEPIETPAPTIRGNVLKVGEKSVALTDEQLSALGMVADAAQKRHEAMVELNERLWRFAMENGGEPEDGIKFISPTLLSDGRWAGTIQYNVLFPVRFRNFDICLRAIKEIIKPYLKEHPELGL